MIISEDNMLVRLFGGSFYLDDDFEILGGSTIMIVESEPETGGFLDTSVRGISDHFRGKI